MKANASESILNVIVILILILACAGVLSSVMWYKAAQREKILHLTVTANLVTIGILRDEVADKKYKIEQANRLLHVCYPDAKLDFINEE